MSILKDKVNRILIKIKDGESGALDELYAATYNHLKLVALNYLVNNSDLDDVLNEAYYKSYKYIKSVNFNRDGYNWLCKIVQHLCYDYNNRRGAVDYVEKVFQNTLFSEIEGEMLEKCQIYQIIQKFSVQDQQLIYLKFWEDLSLSEITKRTGIKKSTIHKRLKKLLNEIYNNSK